MIKRDTDKNEKHSSNDNILSCVVLDSAAKFYLGNL